MILIGGHKQRLIKTTITTEGKLMHDTILNFLVFIPILLAILVIAVTIKK